MRVYRVIPNPTPSGSSRQIYAALKPESKREQQWLGFDEFEGKPFSRKWRPITLSLDKPSLPRPDFLHYDSKVLVCSERTVELLSDVLRAAGELLPIRIKGETHNYYIFNVTNCIDAVDHNRSQWEVIAPEIPDRKRLVKPVFVPGRFGEETLFKLSENFGLKIYCLERNADPGDREFKALVDQHRLTGLEFEPVWSDHHSAPKERKRSARASVKGRARA
jgi:hypothetical protein